jgi:hypothetical protein
LHCHAQKGLSPDSPRLGGYLASRLSSSWVLSFHKVWQGSIFVGIAAPKFFWHFG